MRRLTALLITLAMFFSFVGMSASATDAVEITDAPAEAEQTVPLPEDAPVPQEPPTAEEEKIMVSLITVEPSGQTLVEGDTLCLTAAVFPEDAAVKDVLWSSSNEAVAVVTDGLVTAVGPGEAVITAAAADGSFVSGSAVVYVSENTAGDTDPAENIEITPALFVVSLPEGFTGEPTAEAGRTYIFTADDAEKVYTVSALMGGMETAVMQDAETKAYYIENVTGELAISAVPTEKRQFAVSFLNAEGQSETVFKGEPSVVEGESYSFTFCETPEDWDCFRYLFDASMQDENRQSQKVSVRLQGDASFEIVDSETDEPKPITGELTILYLGRENRSFAITADTSEESAAWQTLSFPTDGEGNILPGVYGQEEPYTVIIRHEEDRCLADGGESQYIYFAPHLKIQDRDGQWQDYFGYSLESVSGDAEYAKLWKLCIPSGDIKGSIAVYADRAEKNDASSVRKITFRGSGEDAGEESIAGLTVFSREALDAGEAQAEDYYFFLKKSASVKSVCYSVGGGEEREPAEPGEGIYKIPKEDITGDIAVTVKSKDIFSVTKCGSGKGEEIYIELPSGTAPANKTYTFNVRHHGKSLYDLAISVTVGGKTFILGDTDAPNDLKVAVSRDTWTVTIPASMVTDDILIAANCKSDVKCTVVFEDAYYAASRYLNYRFTAFKIVQVSENNGVITRKLLDDHIDPATRNIYIEVSPHEKLCFEVVLPGKNAAGKYSSDPNTGCYLYDFSGSVMGGAELGSREYIQDTFLYSLSSAVNVETDGTYHVDYYIGDITGDVTVKLKPIMKKFNVTVNGSGKNEITLSKKTVSYRSNLAFGKSDDVTLDSITVGGQRISLNAGYRFAVDSHNVPNRNSYIIDGSFITGDIVINTHKNSADDVPIVRRTSSLTSSGGTEYSLDISEFRRLKNSSSLYLITAVGESPEYMTPCYDGHEMLYFEPYGAFVWLTLSDEDSDEFCENVDTLFDELREDEVQRRRQKRIASGESTEEKESDIVSAIENYILEGDLNGDYEVDAEDVSLARELYMNTDTDEKAVSLGLRLLADVNRSNTFDMRDAARIMAIAADTDEEEDEEEDGEEENSEESEEEREDRENKRSYTLELCADGKNSVTAEPGEEITVVWKLLRTDNEPDGDAAVSVIQDEIYFDGDLLELLEDCELADGVEMTTFEPVTDGQEEKKENMQCLNLSYLAPEDAAEPAREAVLGVFRFKVIDDGAETVLSHNNAFVIASDGETEYRCEFAELTAVIGK